MKPTFSKTKNGEIFDQESFLQINLFGKNLVDSAHGNSTTAVKLIFIELYALRIVFVDRR